MDQRQKKKVGAFLSDILVRVKGGVDIKHLQNEYLSKLSAQEKEFVNSFLSEHGLHKQLPGSFEDYLTNGKKKFLLARFFPSEHGFSDVDYSEHEAKEPSILKSEAPEFIPGEHHARHHLEHNTGHR